MTSVLVENQHTLWLSEARQFLEGAAKEQGPRFDIVIMDPQSLAKSADERTRGFQKYCALNELALQVLRPGGLLLTCSRSSHVKSQEFVEVIEEAASRVGCAVNVEG